MDLNKQTLNQKEIDELLRRMAIEDLRRSLQQHGQFEYADEASRIVDLNIKKDSE